MSALPQEYDRRRSTEPRDAEPLRLLVVDDDANYCAWLSAMTRRMGFAVDIALDGEAALELLAAKPFDVAVIDQEMPRLTGIELVTRIRSQEPAPTLYALMLTGRGELETKLNALAAGFDDFLSKSAPDEEIVAKLIVARRIATRQRMLNATVNELYGLATRDELTGVFNRRFFMAETERLLAARCIVNVVLFDLDEFKHVNDTYGHLAGDRVLRDVGALFLRHTRPQDLIARYGGDEFVLVVPHITPQEMEHIIERLAADVRALRWSAGEQPFSLEVTVGMASSQLLDEPTIARLLDAADRDLYKNKWLRRNPTRRPELYAYPPRDQRVDLLIPLRESVADDAPAATPAAPASPAAPLTSDASRLRR